MLMDVRLSLGCLMGDYSNDCKSSSCCIISFFLKPPWMQINSIASLPKIILCATIEKQKIIKFRLHYNLGFGGIPVDLYKFKSPSYSLLVKENWRQQNNLQRGGLTLERFNRVDKIALTCGSVTKTLLINTQTPRSQLVQELVWYLLGVEETL